MLGIISKDIKNSIAKRTRGDIHKANRNESFGSFGNNRKNITKEELKAAGIGFLLALGLYLLVSM